MFKNNFFVILFFLLIYSCIGLAGETWSDGIGEPLVGWHDFITVAGDDIIARGRQFYPVYNNPTLQQAIDNGFIVILYNTKTSKLCSGVVPDSNGKPVRTGVHRVLANANGIDLTTGDWVGGGLGVDKDGNLIIHYRESFTAGQTRSATGSGYLREPDIQRRMMQQYIDDTGHTIKPNSKPHSLPVYDDAAKLAANPPGPRGGIGGGTGKGMVAGNLVGAMFNGGGNGVGRVPFIPNIPPKPTGANNGIIGGGKPCGGGGRALTFGTFATLLARPLTDKLMGDKPGYQAAIESEEWYLNSMRNIVDGGDPEVESWPWYWQLFIKGGAGNPNGPTW